MASSENRSPFNMWWFAAAGFVVLILVAAVILGIRIGATRSSGAADETQSTQSVETEAASEREESEGAAEVGTRECSAQLSDNQDYLTEAPPTEWELYGSSSFSIPVSEEFGPAKRDGDLWGCFAHSPGGAVYAGLPLLASFSVGGVYEAAVDSPAAQSALEDEAADAGATFPTFSGFRIDEYSESSARITYYGTTDGHVVGMTFSLLWDETADDWRLDWSRPDGFEENPDASGFVMWER